MTILAQGNLVNIYFDANEGQPAPILLPNGYSFEKIFLISTNNIGYLIPYMQISTNNRYTFPVVNSKSPCYVHSVIIDESKKSEIKFIIEKFGQIPDPHYFEAAFEPILVTGEDGKEYKVIPSDQFK